MSDVKRYDPDVSRRGDAYMDENHDGDYVRYDDYAAIEAELAELRGAQVVNHQMLDALVQMKSLLLKYDFNRIDGEEITANALRVIDAATSAALEVKLAKQSASARAEVTSKNKV